MSALLKARGTALLWSAGVGIGIPLIAPTVLADSKAQSTPNDPSKMVKTSELPIYEDTKDLYDIKYYASEKCELEKTVGVVRKEVVQAIEATKDIRDQVQHVYDTGKAHTAGQIDYILDEENVGARAGAVALGGLVGLIMGARRKGGFFKKLLYTSAGAGVVTAGLHPQQSRELGQGMITDANTYANVAYNFITGVKPQNSSPEAPAAAPPADAKKESSKSSPVGMKRVEVSNPYPAMLSLPYSKQYSLQTLHAARPSKDDDIMAQEMSEVSQLGFRLKDNNNLEGFGSVADVDKCKNCGKFKTNKNEPTDVPLKTQEDSSKSHEDSVKASDIPNLIENFAEKTEDVVEKAVKTLEVVEVVSEKVKSVSEAVEDVAESIESVADKVPVIASKIDTITEEVKEAAKFTETVAELSANVAEKAENILEKSESVLEAVVDVSKTVEDVINAPTVSNDTENKGGLFSSIAKLFGGSDENKMTFVETSSIPPKKDSADEPASLKESKMEIPVTENSSKKEVMSEPKKDETPPSETPVNEKLKTESEPILSELKEEVQAVDKSIAVVVEKKQEIPVQNAVSSLSSIATDVLSAVEKNETVKTPVLSKVEQLDTPAASSAPAEPEKKPSFIEKISTFLGGDKPDKTEVPQTDNNKLKTSDDHSMPSVVRDKPVGVPLPEESKSSSAAIFSETEEFIPASKDQTKDVPIALLAASAVPDKPKECPEAETKTAMESSPKIPESTITKPSSISKSDSASLKTSVVEKDKELVVSAKPSTVMPTAEPDKTVDSSSSSTEASSSTNVKQFGSLTFIESPGVADVAASIRDSQLSMGEKGGVTAADQSNPADADMYTTRS